MLWLLRQADACRRGITRHPRFVEISGATIDPAAEIDAIILETMKQGAISGDGDGTGDVSAGDLYSLAKKKIDKPAPTLEDRKQAARLLVQAANHGDVDAQATLGEMYFLGDGVKRDEKKAILFLSKAAEQGHEEAMTSLGWLYYHDKTGKSAKKLDALAEQVERRGYDVDMFWIHISRPAW